ncbi:hypothetical protein K6119_15965 [Paracrocinitomix mangrovi]|uniref:hypothetical protein n=1 Tax=Paracrocinitomix mangrovi TaxID=2862509 RepID=UPI001C8DA7D2|nr:hypothetical protein [Paracrocinitomix mangrovi]UKN01225.1 hypothetical protein K6119_15965 [Paracrocinitomix mangrovi]
MKKILGLAFGLMLGAFTFAQSPVTFTEDMANYDKNTTTVFHFNFDETISESSINDNAGYYTDYFTIDAVADNGQHNVTITLIQDDAMSRKVIHRYLASLQVQTVSVDGTDVPREEFMQTYIEK